MIESLNIFDNTIILLYFVIVLAIGLYFSKREKQTAQDYFLANRNMGWLVIGFSIFATNISSEHLVGLASSGAERGIAVGHFEWLAVVFIIMLGWIFAPIFLKSNVNTIPELIGKKFGNTSRKIFSGLSIFTYIFTKIAITLLAGGILLKEILGWNFVTSTVIMLLFTGIYTIIGGLRSVMYTQIFQAVLFLVGGFLVLFLGVDAVGGFSNLFNNVPVGHWEIFKPLSDNDFPWLGILIGAPILAAWYWLADQYIVQRILSARNIEQAKKGTVFAASLKILPLFLFILPGVFAIQLSESLSANEAYASLFKSNIFPVGVKGIIISGFFAALMSSLASAFNSTATLIAYDFVKGSNPETNDEQLVLVGRLSTIFIVIGSIMFIPLLRLFSDGMYVNLQSMQAYISPPIVVIFLMGVFWKKATSKAVIWTLVLGEVIGFIRLAADFIISKETNLGIFNTFLTINYLYFAGSLFLFSLIIFVVISFATAKNKNKVRWGNNIALNKLN
ncbi:MAG: sodium/solute symporter [Ignavibacteriae bacterium]|nr:sodium/solute symporter [Ignavibacteriota bacterium]